MAESTSLVDNMDKTTPRFSSSDDIQTPTADHFKRPIKVFTIVTLILSALSIALLIANHIIVRNAPYGYYWDALDASKALIKVMVAALVFSLISVLVNFPILLNVIIDVVLAAVVVANVVGFISAFPNSDWCRIRLGFSDRDRKCEHWKMVVIILMGIVTGFSVIISAIYLVQFLLRSIAIYITKFWKRPLAWTLPTREVTFQVSLKVLRQEHAGQRTEGEAGTSHGPMYL